MASPDFNNPLVANFEVVINGGPIPIELAAVVTGIVVDEDVELPGMFTMEVFASDSQDKNGPEIPWIDDQDLLAIGNELEIKLGYVDALESMMIGEITAIEPEYRFDSLPTLTIRGYDRRHRLLRGRKNRSFVQQKDSDIAEQIAREASLIPEVEDSQVEFEYILQANQTDWEFLNERARRINYEIIVDNKSLIFRPAAFGDSEIITIDMTKGLLEFYPRLSTVRQLNEVVVRGWDPQRKEPIIGRASDGDEVSLMGGQQSGGSLSATVFGDANGLVSDRPVRTQAEADQVAKAQFNSTGLHFISGEGVSYGRTDLRAGKVIKIEGIGQRFGGQYYVTSASHRYSSQGYFTHFDIKRNAI